MAIIKVWVDPTRPDDSGDGLSLATAKKTIPAGLFKLNADGDAKSILNLVNSAVHDWPVSASETDLNNGVGIDFVENFGYLIRGVTSAEALAFVTIKPNDADGDVLRRCIRLRAGSGFNILENVLWNSTSRRTDTSSYNAVRARDNGAGPILIRYCADLGALTGLMSDGERALFETDNTSSSTETFRIEYCYFQNCRSPLGTFASGYGGALLKTRLENCVGIWDVTGRTDPWYKQGGWAGATANATTWINNTFYEDAGTAATIAIMTYNPTVVGAIGTADCHSNLIWIETTGTVNPFMSAISKTAGITHTGSFDSNVLLGGPSVVAGSLTADGWYQGTWDANDDDTTAPDEQPLDTVVYGEADTDVFNDPSSTFEWVMPNGLTITILKDLRPKKYQTSGLFGATPGALPTVSGGDDTDSGGGDLDDPATIPFIDITPIYAPVMRLDWNTRFSTDQNRVEKHYLRDDLEEKSWREYTSRLINVGTTTTKQIISGIETGEFIFMESDEAVQLNAGKVAGVFLPAAKTVLLRGGEYDIVQVKNDSATDAANVLITEVD